MILKRKIDNKGRLVIPTDCLEQSNIDKNDYVYIDVVDNKIIISKEIFNNGSR